MVEYRWSHLLLMLAGSMQVRSAGGDVDARFCRHDGARNRIRDAQGHAVKDVTDTMNASCCSMA
jgi:hypothetical protein